jgi:hypothetical protein
MTAFLGLLLAARVGAELDLRLQRIGLLARLGQSCVVVVPSRSRQVLPAAL